MMAAGLMSNAACGTRRSPGQVVGILSDSINSQPHLYLMQQVDGPTLEAILALIPYPEISSGMAKPAPWLPRPPSPSICGDISSDGSNAKQSPRLTDCLNPTV